MRGGRKGADEVLRYEKEFKEKTVRKMMPPNAVTVAQKNDDLIQPKQERWHSNDDWAPNDRELMAGQNNWYYDDISTNGGWSHSEMIRYTRNYNGEDGTPAQDIVTPLRDNARAIKVALEYGE